MRRFRKRKQEADPEYKRKESRRISILIKDKKRLASPRKKKELDRKNREAVAKHRAKKKEQNQQMIQQDTRQTSSKGFKSPQSFGKAKKRLQDILPRSPTKRKQLIQGIADDESVVLQRMMNKALNENDIGPVEKLVKDFYLREDISYTAPGMKEEMTVWQGGMKLRLRKHYLMMYLKEAFATFKLENPGLEMCFSRFASLRPKNVLLVKDSPADQCKCSIHENFKLKLKGLSIQYENEGIWKEFLCENKNLMSACWKGECDKCRGGKLFENRMVGSEKGKSVSWRVWEKDGNGRLVESLKEGCVGQLEEDICETWDSVRAHVRTKRIQSDLFHILKSNPQGSLLQVDFAMAYTCQYQNEVQGALWSRQTVNLFTAAFFSGGKYEKSFLFVTDNKDKGKNSVLTFLRFFLGVIEPSQLGESFCIFSDGPSPEFKNKYCVHMLHLLQKEFHLNHIKFQWSYFATSHGKGIVDGIGGRAKSLVRTAVMNKKNDVIVQNGEQFANVAKRLMEKTEVVFVESKIIDEVDDEKPWEGVQECPGIRNVHCVILNNGTLNAYRNALEQDEHVFRIVFEKERPVCVGDQITYAVGDWVVVQYDHKQYFGEIVAVVKGEDMSCDFEVNVMHEQRGGVFKWPGREDKILYKERQIVKKVDPPVPVGCRNQFKFV